MYWQWPLKPLKQTYCVLSPTLSWDQERLWYDDDTISHFSYRTPEWSPITDTITVGAMPERVMCIHYTFHPLYCLAPTQKAQQFSLTNVHTRSLILTSSTKTFTHSHVMVKNSGSVSISSLKPWHWPRYFFPQTCSYTNCLQGFHGQWGQCVIIKIKCLCKSAV